MMANSSIDRTYLSKKVAKPISQHRNDFTTESSNYEHEVDEEKLDADDSACYMGEAPGETLVFEYHILYSESYSVPVMYFNVHKQDGKLLPLEQVWELIPDHYQERLQNDRWTFLTQQEHPYLGRPFYQLHPCHTESLMSCVETISQHSKVNYLISWLSVVGPVVCLDVPMAYGQTVGDKEKGENTGSVT